MIEFLVWLFLIGFTYTLITGLAVAGLGFFKIPAPITIILVIIFFIYSFADDAKRKKKTNENNPTVIEIMQNVQAGQMTVEEGSKAITAITVPVPAKTNMYLDALLGKKPLIYNLFD